MFNRPVGTALRAALTDTPVVCLLGARQSGKSTPVQTLKPNYAYVTFDDDAALAFAQSDPTGFVAALRDPVILDEVGIADRLPKTKSSDGIV